MATDLSALAKRLVDAAAAAHAREDGLPPAGRVLREYRGDARAITVAVLRAVIPARKSAGDVVLELPDLGPVPLGELIAAVEKVEVP